MKGRDLTEQQRERIRQLHSQGLAKKIIAERVDVSVKSVLRTVGANVRPTANQSNASTTRS